MNNGLITQGIQSRIIQVLVPIVDAKFVEILKGKVIETELIKSKVIDKELIKGKILCQ